MPALEIIALDTTTPQLRAPSAADTYTAPRAMDITPVALTGSAATSSLSIAQTWNTTGTPTAIDLNVTDTASNGSSLLMNLRVGGVSRARVRKDGRFIGTDFELISGQAVTNSGGIMWLYGPGVIASGGVRFADVNVANVDTILLRDAANTLAQRNGVNAQEKRVYGTYTDASNHRRVAMGMSASGVGFIRPEGAGTGATGNVLHISGLPTSNPGPGILWNNAGSVAIGT
jgi:hypothetical protein